MYNLFSHVHTVFHFKDYNLETHYSEQLKQKFNPINLI